MVYAPVSRRAKLLETPPLLIVEVLSTSSKREDLGRKLGLYARGGAAFYWVVDPDAEEVTVLANDSGRFVPTQQLTDGVASELTQPFPVRLDLTALFA